MPLSQEQNRQIISEYQRAEGDTGSSEVQVALLTARINHLTEHLKQNPKDFGCRRGLQMLVGQRRRLLNYLRSKSKGDSYKKLISRLGLRK